MYDQFQRVAMQADVAVAILANADTTDIELLPVMPHGPGEDLDALAQRWAGRGLAFIGVMGTVDGVPQTALDVPLDATRMRALSEAFARHCERIGAAELEPEYDWTARQYRLVPRIH